MSTKKILITKTATTKTYLEKKHLNVPLTNEELLEKGDQAARLQEEITALEVEKKIEVARFGRLIKSQQERLAFVLETVKKKTEYKEVESEVIYDYEAKKVLYTYEGEVLAERTMGEDELQFTLFEEMSEEQFKEFKKQNDEKKKEIVKLRIAQEKANQEAAEKPATETPGEVKLTEEYPDQIQAAQSEVPEGVQVNISTEGTLAKVEVKDANKK